MGSSCFWARKVWRLWKKIGAAANLACFRWLGQRNKLSELQGIPRVTTHPVRAGFNFGGGRPGRVRYPADIPMGIGGSRGAIGASVLGADIPLVLLKRALEPVGGQLDFSDVLTLWKRGWTSPCR